MITGLESKPLSEMLDLLVNRTEELLIALEDKKDGQKIRKLKSEVETIQKAIKARKNRKNS